MYIYPDSNDCCNNWVIIQRPTCIKKIFGLGKDAVVSLHGGRGHANCWLRLKSLLLPGTSAKHHSATFLITTLNNIVIIQYQITKKCHLTPLFNIKDSNSYPDLTKIKVIDSILMLSWIYIQIQLHTVI